VRKQERTLAANSSNRDCYLYKEIIITPRLEPRIKFRIKFVTSILLNLFPELNRNLGQEISNHEDMLRKTETSGERYYIMYII
jgi:hypothetical protein